MARKTAEPERKLSKYRQKRDFSKTREPLGEGETRKGRSFVIQKHHARRLHWDLRLEVNGVLASWAVPKEPPHSTGVKRLAVHVEDHPLEYGSFEGEIPKGEYGAGKVEIWDKGDYESPDDVEKQIREGMVKFTLHGERLEGKYALVRLKPRDEDDGKDNWLLFKDEKTEKLPPPTGVKPGKAPTTLRPMLCTQKNAPPAGDEWLHEIKWDGYRVMAFIHRGEAIVKTRNDNRLKLVELEKTLSEADEIEDGIIDGEVVVLNERGISSFGLAQNVLRSKDTREAIFFAFDLPFFAGMDLRGTPIEHRKAILERLVEQIGSERIRYSAHSVGGGRTLFEQACEMGIEGIVSKKLGSAYSSVRSPNWVKARCEQRLEGWIGGFTRLSSGQDLVGALLVGLKSKKGDFVYVGRAGTGFSDAQRSTLWKELSDARIEKPAFEPSPDLPKKGAYWVEPVIPVTVQYLEWSEGGVMRQPKLISFGEPATKEPAKPSRIWTREHGELEVKDFQAADKRKTKNEKRETPPIPQGTRHKTQDARRKKQDTPHTPHPTSHTPHPLPVRITNPDRIIDPGSKLTKGDVAAYYHEVSELILPYLANRPLPVLRCPSGVEGSCFFHKHWIKGLPDDVGKIDVEEESGEDEPYMYVTELKGLLALAQFGVIELHPWGSQIETLEQPDILIFDLDPDEGMEWSTVAEAAHEVREHLESINLKTFPKLSGGKGVHLVVPIEPELEWDTAKAFCENFARLMAKQFPDRYTAVMSKAQRKGKIFLDYLRNGRGATAVTAYSLRARPNLTVAMPVEWDEVRKDLKPNAFDLKTALKHLEKRKSDPWKGFYEARKPLKKLLGL